MPEPVSRYQSPEAAATSTPASFQSFSSALWVPESSPREAKGALLSAILASDATTSFEPAMPAGSAGGPTTTKSLYITSKRSTPPPSAMNFSSAALACTSSTSPSPFSAFLIAWPVPTATTRTSIPVFLVNSGSSTSNRPEFCVEVVDCTMMNRSSAIAPGKPMLSPMSRAAALERNVRLFMMFLTLVVWLLELVVPREGVARPGRRARRGRPVPR